MNTKFIMVFSSLVIGLLGIVFTFLPDEALNFLAGETATPMSYLLQITGALYLGFAMMNWWQKQF